MPLTYTEKVQYYREALKDGLITDMVNPLEYANKIESYLETNPPEQISPGIKVQAPDKSREFESGAIFHEKLPTFDYSLSPAQQREFFLSQMGDKEEMAAAFNLGDYPYEAVTYKKNGSAGIGLATGIDRYELAYNALREPVYLKFMKGVDKPEVLDKEKFDREKNFNILPNSLKKKYKALVI